jgi:hypothetical protein
MSTRRAPPRARRWRRGMYVPSLALHACPCSFSHIPPPACACCLAPFTAWWTLLTRRRSGPAMEGLASAVVQVRALAPQYPAHVRCACSCRHFYLLTYLSVSCCRCRTVCSSRWAARRCRRWLRGKVRAIPSDDAQALLLTRAVLLQGGVAGLYGGQRRWRRRWCRYEPLPLCVEVYVCMLFYCDLSHPPHSCPPAAGSRGWRWSTHAV